MVRSIDLGLPLWLACLGATILVALVQDACQAQWQPMQRSLESRHVKSLADESSELASRRRAFGGVARFAQQPQINYGHLFDGNARTPSSARSFELEPAPGGAAQRRRMSKQRRLKSSARSMSSTVGGRKSRARALKMSKARALAMAARQLQMVRSMRHRRAAPRTKQEEATEMIVRSFEDYDKDASKSQQRAADRGRRQPASGEKQSLARSGLFGIDLFPSTPAPAGGQPPKGLFGLDLFPPLPTLLPQPAAPKCDCPCAKTEAAKQPADQTDPSSLTARSGIKPKAPANEPPSAHLELSPAGQVVAGVLDNMVSGAQKLQDSVPQPLGESELKLSNSRVRVD